MKFDAPIRLVRDILTDLVTNPKGAYRLLARYQNLRSLSYPEGNVPLADIFDLVPDAGSRKVVFEGIFEVPVFPRNLPGEGERYTAKTTLADSYVLALLANKFATNRILEVGTSFGQSALLFALNTPDNVQITTLDIQKVADNPTVGIQFRGHPLSTKIVQCASNLEEILPTLAPKSFDLIFIDGDHSYAGVLSDSLAALSLIRPGGVICWHDYMFRFRHDVVRALDQVRSEKGVNIRKIAYTNVSAAIMEA